MNNFCLSYGFKWDFFLWDLNENFKVDEMEGYVVIFNLRKCSGLTFIFFIVLRNNDNNRACFI